MRIIYILVLSLFSLLALTASANVTYNISGVVKNWTPPFGSNPSTYLPLNTTFSGTVVYDPTAVGNAPLGNDQTYSFVSSSVTFHPLAGDWTASSDQTNNVVTVSNGTYADEIQFSAEASGPALGEFSVSSLQIAFGGSNLVLGSTELPGSLNLDDWYSGYGYTYVKLYFNDYAASTTAEITGMSLAAVPEPSTYGLIIGGTVLGLVLMLRGRQRRKS